MSGVQIISAKDAVSLSSLHPPLQIQVARKALHIIGHGYKEICAVGDIQIRPFLILTASHIVPAHKNSNPIVRLGNNMPFQKREPPG